MYDEFPLGILANTPPKLYTRSHFFWHSRCILPKKHPESLIHSHVQISCISMFFPHFCQDSSTFHYTVCMFISTWRLFKILFTIKSYCLVGKNPSNGRNPYNPIYVVFRPQICTNNFQHELDFFPPPRMLARHHEDYWLFRIANLEKKPSFATGSPGWRVDPNSSPPFLLLLDLFQLFKSDLFKASAFAPFLGGVFVFVWQQNQAKVGGSFLNATSAHT